MQTAAFTDLLAHMSHPDFCTALPARAFPASMSLTPPCMSAVRRKDFMRQMNTSAYDESDDEDDGRPRGVQCAQQ